MKSLSSKIRNCWNYNKDYFNIGLKLFNPSWDLDYLLYYVLGKIYDRKVRGLIERK